VQLVVHGCHSMHLGRRLQVYLAVLLSQLITELSGVCSSVSMRLHSDGRWRHLG
jgi:hypothetical protein